ncbi:hypothetical protein LO763_04195 [Glycomyces sp. A-F 0318]|uniref:hypothetical protein n=1 Tax=Glycomyces amatae TaxID=2881355 RepID=UPI001E563031|nr:hypothetical protein [Glycomyces amatae]MCD0442824.1 hypothetical protein [Glycomyces amatae]
MTPDAPPEGYPDVAASGLVRVADIEFLEFKLQMTTVLGERFVKVWELEEGVPARWFGNVFRVDAEPPGLYLNYRYERMLDRFQRDQLARLGAEFWSG